AAGYEVPQEGKRIQSTRIGVRTGQRSRNAGADGLAGKGVCRGRHVVDRDRRGGGGRAAVVVRARHTDREVRNWTAGDVVQVLVRDVERTRNQVRERLRRAIAPVNDQREGVAHARIGQCAGQVYRAAFIDGAQRTTHAWQRRRTVVHGDHC